jgi:acetyl-CoA carboxylase biotin carboxyl carrier protein
MTATTTGNATATVITSPGPGWFTPRVKTGELIGAGGCIGVLEVLGVRRSICLERGAGRARLAVTDGIRSAVQHGQVLAWVDAAAVAAGDPSSQVETAVLPSALSSTGLLVRSPSSGRFYGRPGPGKPPFVVAGDIVKAGDPLCLLEVMKTFHRITYGGAEFPARARVTRVLVTDDADLAPGQAIVELEEIP